jgi:hypothetical protein
MTLGAAILVCLAGGVASILLAPRLPRVAAGVVIAASAGALLLGLATSSSTSFVVGGASITATDAARLTTIGWSTGLLLLSLIGIATLPVGLAPTVGGAGLVALAGGIVAVSVDQLDVAFAALAVGGIAAVLVPMLAGWLSGHDEEAPLAVTGRAIVATAGAAVVAIVVVAWSQSSAGPLGAAGPGGGGVGAGGVAGGPDAAMRTAVGVAVIVMAALVVLRSGAIPAHLWAAGFVGAATPLAIPSLLAWGTATFTLVAAGWARDAVGAGPFVLDDVGRWLVVLVALTSLVLGGLAALLHDDIEHVLGYSLVQDTGVALLAFASLRPETAAPLMTWLIASAALKTGLAAWIAVIRWSYGTHRLSELRGWARRAPILGTAFAVLLLGSVGLPGMAIFEARVALVSAALPGAIATAVIVLALSPLLVLGRVLATGLLDRPGADVAGASDERIGRPAASLGGWSRGGPRWWLRAGVTVIRANEGLGVSVATILLAAVGLALAIAGAGDVAGTGAG